MAEGEGEAAPEEEKKKGGMKKLIIKIVPLLLIALVIAKMTVLKPPPPTAAAVAEKAAKAKLMLDTTCAQANDLKAPKAAPAKEKDTTPTTAAPAKGTPTTPTTVAELGGPTLDLDSKTINLDGSHFLKIGISLQLPAKAVPDTVKTTENWGSMVSQLVIDTFSGRSFTELTDDHLRQSLQHQIGNEVCEKTDGKVVTVYLTDFVMQ
jgi:flagellar basal body-associated protein FliL